MLLYDLPNPLIGFIIVVFTIFACLSGYFLYHRIFRIEVSESDRELAMSVLGIVATVHSLLLAFSAVSVWESHGAAEASVVNEANTVAQLARDLAVFDSPEGSQARDELRTYVSVVLEDEWPRMRRGEASDQAWQAVDEVFRDIARMEPDTPKRQAIIEGVWLRVNDLVKLRRDRIYASQSEIPLTLWTVVLIGTVLTMLTTFVLPPTRFNVYMIATLAFSVGLVFFFLIAMDRPFAGQEGIDPGPFRLALDNMANWDRASTPR